MTQYLIQREAFKVSTEEALIVPDNGHLAWGPYNSVFEALRGLLEKMWQEAHMWLKDFSDKPWAIQRVDALLAGIIELELGSLCHVEVDGITYGVHPKDQEDET